MNQNINRLVLSVIFAGAVALAQTQAQTQVAQGSEQPQPPGPGGPPPQAGRGGGPSSAPGNRETPPPPRANRPPLERALPSGRFWNNPEMVQKLNLNSDQQKKMEDIFQQNRLRLIDLNATLQKEEITMEPLMQADSPDEAKVVAQIDKVAQARAELEKANARFLLAIRRVLTADQWKKLQTENSPAAGGPGRGPGTAPGAAPGGNPPPPAARKGR